MSQQRPQPTQSDERVRRLHASVSDAELAKALQAGQNWASFELWHRYGPHARRILLRVLGPREEVDDLLQDVFVQVFRNTQQLQDPHALKGWISIVAVNTARKWLRSKKRWSWIFPREDDFLKEVPAAHANEQTRSAVRALHRILDRLPVDEQLAFALRHVDQMELTEVAQACETSLATIKRRLQRAETFVFEQAQKEEELHAWLGGERWTRK